MHLSQGCSTFYLSLDKYLSESLSQATIAAIIKVMFSCELVQKFLSSKQVFSKKNSLHSKSASDLQFSSPKPHVLRSSICLRALFCRLNVYYLHVGQCWTHAFQKVLWHSSESFAQHRLRRF